MSELTQLFSAVNAGDRGALDRLMAVMYPDLHRLAHRRLYAAGGHSLDTTGLVHESYLRFLKAGRLQVTDRGHFLAYSSRVMRSIIVDLVRRHRREKRGGGALQVTLNTQLPEDAGASDERLLRLNDALEEMGRAEPRLMQVVEMRYFAGLLENEIAEALGVTERTVRRDWQRARMLLSVALE
jgi:RNA polymerase sigma factor (TIGR02999 family)